MIFHNFKNFHEKKRYIKFEIFSMAFFDHILALCRIWYCGMECTDSGGNIAPVPDAVLLTEGGRKLTPRSGAKIQERKQAPRSGDFFRIKVLTD